MSSAAADTSEDKDDEEIVALLPTSSADDRKGDGLVADNIRRTPGPNAMRRPNQNEEELHRRTPLVSNSRRASKTASQRQLYTPAHFTLSKNPHLSMDGGRPEVFSPNTIRMTDSLDKLLRDDDEDDGLDGGAEASLSGDARATPRPLKFDENRVGAFEPPKPSAIKTLRGSRADAHVPSTKGGNSLHTPKPQRVPAARYGRETSDAMVQIHHHQQHLPPHMNNFDPYQGNRVPMHDHFFTPLVENPNMRYSEMHQYGHIPTGVVSPMTIPEYPPSHHYPMHAASWSPIPPEFDNHNMTAGRDHWQQQPPPPSEYHPHAPGYDQHHYQQMSIPRHNPQYHLPGNVSPFIPHYNHHIPSHAPSYQHSNVPLSPQRQSAEVDSQYGTLPHGRLRKDSFASVNSGLSSKNIDDGSPPAFRHGLQNNSSEEELKWFAPVASGEVHPRGGAHAHQQIYELSGQSGNNIYITDDKKQMKKGNVKQPKSSRQGQELHQPKSVQSKGVRSTSSVPNSSNQEFLESPSERAAFKEFGRQFRQKESLDTARDYAIACLSKSNPDIYLPPSIHWRVYLELADVAKRCNEIDNARNYYHKACKLQPMASQGWMEHSKLEEECGNIKKCSSILEEGLSYCTANENLLIRAIKFRERVGQLDQARQLLGHLKHLPVEKYWKVMMEGALLEARAGKYMSVAREIFKYLTHNISWYGPLHLAHTKLERDYGTLPDAFEIVEKGLKELPRYGPLYFQAFCLLEKEDLSRDAYDLPRTTKMIARADNSISRELLWKVHLEAAQIQERATKQRVQKHPTLQLNKCLGATRKSYSKALVLCPPNLCWKIWLASGRTEISCGNIAEARVLFLRAYESVSEKGRSTVLLECARLEELCQDLQLARAILTKARLEFGKSDWKVWLAIVNLESRCGQTSRAIKFAENSLKIHFGTGRLWASLIQLRHGYGEIQQVKTLKRALQAVPKSGEVWCEGARLHLNPFSPTFDLHAADRHLSFATRFTPQYGDSFLEQLRLALIDQCLVPMAEPLIHNLLTSFVARDKMNLTEAYSFIGDQVKHAADVVKTQLNDKSYYDGAKFLNVLDTLELELHCSSADPNYGGVWFQCRNSPIASAAEVVDRAKSLLACDIAQYSFLYVAALVRRAAILFLLHSRSGQLPLPNSHEWDVVVHSQLRNAPSLKEMLYENGNETDDESNLCSQMFTTAYVENNECWSQRSFRERQRILFGSDSLLS